MGIECADEAVLEDHAREDLKA